MKTRIIYREDGGVSVVYPAPKSKRQDETEDQWLDRVFSKATPEGAEFKDIDTDKEDLSDRTFRGAWVKGLNGKAVDVDIPKAREITKERLRKERKPLLDAQDVLYMRAQETGADTKAIIVEKQRLRDVTKLADEAKTLDELKGLSLTK